MTQITEIKTKESKRIQQLKNLKTIRLSSMERNQSNILLLLKDSDLITKFNNNELIIDYIFKDDFVSILIYHDKYLVKQIKYSYNNFIKDFDI